MVMLMLRARGGRHPLGRGRMHAPGRGAMLPALLHPDLHRRGGRVVVVATAAAVGVAAVLHLDRLVLGLGGGRGVLDPGPGKRIQI